MAYADAINVRAEAATRAAFIALTGAGEDAPDHVCRMLLIMLITSEYLQYVILP